VTVYLEADPLALHEADYACLHPLLTLGLESLARIGLSNDSTSPYLEEMKWIHMLVLQYPLFRVDSRLQGMLLDEIKTYPAVLGSKMRAIFLSFVVPAVASILSLFRLLFAIIIYLECDDFGTVKDGNSIVSKSPWGGTNSATTVMSSEYFTKEIFFICI